MANISVAVPCGHYERARVTKHMNLGKTNAKIQLLKEEQIEVFSINIYRNLSSSSTTLTTGGSDGLHCVQCLLQLYKCKWIRRTGRAGERAEGVGASARKGGIDQRQTKISKDKQRETKKDFF